MLYNAAILFFPVNEHKEFWSLSLIGSTFDFVTGTCFIISWHPWKTLERFVPWGVSHEVEQVEVCLVLLVVGHFGSFSRFLIAC